MRIVAVDVGRRRIGLAISDPSATLARPLLTLHVTLTRAVAMVATEIARLAAEDEGLGTVVVGLPRHLDGSDSEQTAYVRRFIAELRERIPVPVAIADERLTSREAEGRLAHRERDWRKRKLRLDAVAAAVILQDYLDKQSRI